MFDPKIYTQKDLDQAKRNAFSEGHDAGYNVGVETADRKIESLEAKQELELNRVNAEHTNEITTLKSDHAIALKEKEFEINHKNDDDKLKLKSEVQDLTTKLAVANETIKQLDRIIDLDGDIVNVQELIKDLIGKLPEIKITSLSVPAQQAEPKK
jgi:hypothetical protein